MSGPTDTEVVVVGGGMAGVSIAAAIARRRRVVLVEQEEQLAQHATGRSAAMYIASYGPPVVRALTRASRAALDDASPAGVPVLRPRPLLWSASDDGALVELDRMCVDQPELERLDRTEVRHLHDALQGDRLRGAVDRDACDIDVLALHQHHVHTARAAEVDIRRGTRMLGATSARDDRLIVDTTAGSIRAEVVVDAAGAWADVVAEAFGAAPVGLRALRRTIAVARPSRPIDPDWPFVVDVGGGFYFRPEGPHVLASPADETPQPPGEARAEELDVALALDRVNGATDLGLRSVQSSWACLRTFSPDGNPVVGFDPDVAGLFWFAGQGGYGIQLSPALAELGAALVTSANVPEHIAAEGLVLDDVRAGRFRPVA